MSASISLPRLYAVADSSFGDPVQLASALFEGGVTLLQIRNKTAAARLIVAETDRILSFSPPEARVIVNDRADVAHLTGAAGVHLGQDDLPPPRARELLAPGSVIGRSTHNLEQALAADSEPVDYIAVGPIFATTTKKNADAPVGLEGLREICSRVSKPVVAIGGITLESARDVIDCGAASVAVISGLLRYPDLAVRARAWITCLESN